MRRLVPLLAAIAIVAAACSGSSEAAIPTLPGLDAVDTGPTDAESAPDFTVATYEGDTFSLSAHLADDGRPVFLNLWASWCFPCREEMPTIDAADARHPGVKFIGVAVQDSRAEAEAFAAEIQVAYTLGFDDDNVVDDGYRPLGLPASYIISENGLILERIFGLVTDELLDQKLSLWFGG